MMAAKCESKCSKIFKMRLNTTNALHFKSPSTKYVKLTGLPEHQNFKFTFIIKCKYSSQNSIKIINIYGSYFQLSPIFFSGSDARTII